MLGPVNSNGKCRHGKYSKYIRLELLLNVNSSIRPYAYRASGPGFIKLLMLNSTDRALNFDMPKNKDSSCLKLSGVVFILLVNVKMSTNVGI